MTIIIQGLLLLALAMLATAAMHDVMARTVPNRLAASLAATGLGLQAIQGSLLFGTLAALAVFFAAVLCWRRGWMGGGDVKLLGATALLVPPASVPALVAAISLFGGALALIYLLARHRVTTSHIGLPRGLVARAIRAERWRLRRGGPLPYAVAIACGAAFIILTSINPMQGLQQ